MKKERDNERERERERWIWFDKQSSEFIYAMRKLFNHPNLMIEKWSRVNIPIFQQGIEINYYYVFWVNIEI